MNQRHFCKSFAIALPLLFAASLHAAGLTNLRCEYRENPLGIDVAKPRLSWVIEDQDPRSEVRGLKQTAYQVLVASSEGLLAKDQGDLWDSGKVASDRSVAIPYGGPALESGRTCHWRVRVWDGMGKVSAWSETARWTMGKLKPEDWSARWIGVPPTSSGTDLDGVVINRATYRTLDGKVAVDVTPILKKALDQKRIPFHVHFNDLGGDPALNVIKELVVEYTRHGKPEVSSAQDFGHLAIPNGPVGIPAPWFRGEFSLTEKPGSALVTVHSPGYFELYANGVKVGDDVLTPAVSISEACTFTVTCDVARLLKPGKNCLGLWTAKGWAGGIAVRAQLDAVVAGRKVTFGTGPEWKTRPSGYSHIGNWTWGDFGGDRINAAEHLPDWCQPGIDTSSWANAVDSPAPQGAPVNHIAPPFTGGGGGPPWAGVIAALPWQHYLHYGDTRVLEDNFAAARRYVEYLDSRSTHEVLRTWGDGLDFLGDWVPPRRGMDTKNWPTSEMAELFCNCYRVYLWQLVGNMAAALGRNGEAEHARQRVATIHPAVHAAFYDATNKRYVIDEQIYYAMPLLTGVTPDGERPAVMANLVKCLVEKNKGHLDTGMLGTKFLLRFLSDVGRDDLVLTIYQKREYPGWGYMVEQGATTLWEQWNGFWSQIHSCFASADTWLYQGLAGIRPDPAAPGFKRIIIKPAVVGDLTWVKCHHDSPYGRIVSNWKREGQKLTMEVTIPANTTATVHVPVASKPGEDGPAKDATGVTESGKSADQAKGVKFLRMEHGAAVYAIGSGTYRFDSSLTDTFN
jgi:hypothetical protein